MGTDRCDLTVCGCMDRSLYCLSDRRIFLLNIFWSGLPDHLIHCTKSSRSAGSIYRACSRVAAFYMHIYVFFSWTVNEGSACVYDNFLI